MSKCIVASNVVAGYGGNPILDDVNVRINPGKITALIGPNGCGKSTLLRVLGRQLIPDSGLVRLGQTNIRKLSSRAFARDVSFLPQHPQAPNGITVRELIGYGRYPYTGAFASLSTRDHEAIEEAANRAGVWPLLDHPVENLSGGQRQRAWIAMTLAQQTPIVLLDEPTTYLDPSHQVSVLDLVANLGRHGSTVVMVLHDMTQAARYADVVVAMANGEVVADGPTEDVLDAKLIRQVFEMECLHVVDPETGRPLPVPYRPSS